jgi:hypothetical protein
MSWVGGQNYRGKAVKSEFAIKMIPTTGTRTVEGMIEVTMGPQQGERVRWRGYLNSPENVARATAELRAMGWTGAKWGDWSGLGSREGRFKLMTDQGKKPGEVYYRAAFFGPIPTMDRSTNAVTAEGLNELNAMLPPPPIEASTNGARMPAAPAEGGEEANVDENGIPF